MGLGLFPRRAVLNVAMLLRDSGVARAVRRSLLDAAEQVEWSQALVALAAERAAAAVGVRLRELMAAQEVLAERVRALEAQRAASAGKVARDEELLAAMSARLAEATGAVRTLGGRVDLLCTASATPGRGRRRQQR